jgi:uncharacterized protein YaeQ
VATAATMYRFQIELSNIDSSVYESLDLRVAMHPSEDAERVMVRVLARALAHEEGLEFGRGLSNTDDATLWSHTDTGQIGTWIDVGLPSAERLHRASKKSERLLIFTHKPEAALRREWKVRKIHRAAEMKVFRLPPVFVQRLAETLERKMSLFITVHDGVLSVGIGDLTVDGVVEEISMTDLLLSTNS